MSHAILFPSASASCSRNSRRWNVFHPHLWWYWYLCNSEHWILEPQNEAIITNRIFVIWKRRQRVTQPKRRFVKSVWLMTAINSDLSTYSPFLALWKPELPMLMNVPISWCWRGRVLLSRSDRKVTHFLCNAQTFGAYSRIFTQYWMPEASRFDSNLYSGRFRKLPILWSDEASSL